MHPNKKSLLIKSARGFTLIEILIALTLLAVAGTFVVGKFFAQYQEGLQNSAKIQINGLADRLKEFRRHCFFYPTTDQGLEALISAPSGGRKCERYAPGGYIDSDKIPDDPWGNPFMYESDGKSFNIWSYGADGEEGGEGYDADVSYKNGSSPNAKTEASEEAPSDSGPTEAPAE